MHCRSRFLSCCKILLPQCCNKKVINLTTDIAKTQKISEKSTFYAISFLQRAEIFELVGNAGAHFNRHDKQ